MGDAKDITVTGWRLRSLDDPALTASRLALSVRETPATIDSISSGEMLTRGFRTVEEATDSLPGIISGGSPGDPSLFSMRGFTGEQVTILHNGLYLGPANMINRPGNTWNIATIDVLQGPASVLYGQGAVGGAVNIVNKHPDFTRDGVAALVSYGSFDTLSTGVGVNRRMGDDWAARIDASYHRTGGYVRDTPSDSLNVTGAIAYRPNDRFSIELSLDYLNDDLSPYYGTPLVPASFGTDPIRGILSTPDGRVVDRRTRYVSYNVADHRTHSTQYWPRLVLDWSPTSGVTISNTAYYFHADRRWINAENYIFDGTTKLIDRDRFFVFHKQDLEGDQASLTIGRPVFGLANKLVGGIDYSHLNFIRSRGFPDGDSVDPFSPSPGLFGPIQPRVSPTRWDQAALFGEDVLTLAPGLNLVTGLRAERLYLTRENYNADGGFNAATSFRRTYRLFNWRAGVTYDVTPRVTAYASYATGKDPVNSNIFLVNANENFAMSRAQQVEVGVKADVMNGRGSLTAAAYDIRRHDILTLTAVETLTNVGEQKSRGFEFSSEFRVTPTWALTGNWTYTDAKYEDFVDPNYGVNASGNRPANVPDWTANAWTTFRHVAGLPLELGGGVKYVGNRDGNTANTLKLKDYATGVLYATYTLRAGLDATVRVNNLWDKAFVQWADIYYPAQVQLGEPRRVEASLVAHF
ncbi:TonB-dependent receptor [Sphingomonas bacterium]|uniref:TonB-dependent receptor n=1 Tax=Sphingomonas bacterium TaxID=1895847 RepID=UPI0020C6107B|nr:TonB-dependent receptor [Sphingomonas bacterium]